MLSNKIKSITKLSIVAALYVALTYIFGFISFGEIQFRIAEILMLLCFFNHKYTISLVIGCFISNLFSPYGLPDIIFGTLATFMACLGIMLFNKKHLFLASLMVPIGNIIVGIEIAILNSFSLIPALLAVLWVFIGEFVVVCIVGVPLIKLLMKNEKFEELVLEF
jgi:uncharacterized membrane protein